MKPFIRLAPLGLAWLISPAVTTAAPPAPDPLLVPPKPIGQGYAATGINSAIFRQGSLVTFENTQYAAFYDATGAMVLAKRALTSPDWETRVTPHQGKVVDVHNVISLGVDGRGVLHVSWDHHNNPLNYCRGVAPGSLELTEKLAMTGGEKAVTYPQFFSLPGGDLLFAYRTGRAAAGDLLMNRWDAQAGRWTALPGPVVSGEGARSPYWQIAVDPRGGAIHVSWCWRELQGNKDLLTNHDICYARSDDGGRTWVRAGGERYDLPITAARAELAWPVPQRSNLANMSSMAVDSRGRPFIAMFWRPEGDATEQMFVIFHDGKPRPSGDAAPAGTPPASPPGWRLRPIGRRTSHPIGVGRPGGFTLSRPRIVLDRADRAHVVFLDAARGSRVTIAAGRDADYREWAFQDVTAESVGDWEPTYDVNLWDREQVLHLLVQKCQVGYPRPATPEAPPEPVWILPWRPAP